MTEFSFEAPTLVEPAAIPSERLCDELHDALGMAEHLATIEKFALWLRTEMDVRGVSAGGPFVDEGGWVFQAGSDEAFAVCIVTGPNGGNTHLHMLVSEYGSTTKEFSDAIEAILRNSSEISELKIEP